MECDEKCKEPYNYKNYTKKCVEKCNEFPYIVEDEDNKECLIFKKFEITSIDSNSLFYSNQTEIPK